MIGDNTLFSMQKKIEQFSNIYLTHCAQSAKIILTIRNNPCKNMGDILEKGDENMTKDEWYILDDDLIKAILTVQPTSKLEYLKPYIKQVAIYRRALELACEKYIGVDGISYVLRYDLSDEEYFNKSDEQVQKETIDYFVSQAKKELEE